MVTPRWGHSEPAHFLLSELFKHLQSEFAATLRNIKTLESEILQLPSHILQSPSFHCLDVAALYAFIAMYKPAAYCEIGSGTSTLVAKASIERHSPSTKIISIGPEPWSAIDEICDVSIRQTLDKVPLEVFRNLRSNDIVFLDGSHICNMNSDVVIFFLEILPVLKSGVIIHVHDILLPFDYPLEWSSLNEQYMLATFLLFSKDFKILLPAYFTNLEPSLNKIMARQLRGGGSFWFTKQ